MIACARCGLAMALTNAAPGTVCASCAQLVRLGAAPPKPTLRQRYAMAALTGILACVGRIGDTQGRVARAAFEIADAMIAAEKAETP